MDSPDALVGHMLGRVWEVCMDGDDSIAQFDSFLISNVRRDGDKITIRMLSYARPDESAVSVKPNLEDVFLWNFGEVEKGLSRRG